MTRKRIGEGLLESLSEACPTCEGRGLVFDQELVVD
jgi:ribonuclease E